MTDARTSMRGSDLSVVIQGPVHRSADGSSGPCLTERVIQSVRKHYPGCEIILSSWKGSVGEDLGADVVIENEDPGAVPFNAECPELRQSLNNINRQIVSTRAGLARASRRYAMKLRTDTLINSALDIEGLLDRIPPGRSAVFSKRIGILNLYTRHPERRPILFFLSDLFHVGLLEDVRTLWDIEVVDEPAFSRTIDPRRRPWINVLTPGLFLFRVAAEQYLGECLCRRLDGSLRLRHYSEGSKRLLYLWLSALASNFVILRPEEAGLQLPHHIARHSDVEDLVQPADWDSLRPWSDGIPAFSVRMGSLYRFNLNRFLYSRAEVLRRIPSPVSRIVRGFYSVFRNKR